MSRRPRAVAGSKTLGSDEAHLALHLALAPERRPDLAAVAELMRRPALQGAVLDLDLSLGLAGALATDEGCRIS